MLSYRDIKDNLDFQIESNTQSISKQVSDLIDTSAKSYLMGIGNSVSQISESYYRDNNRNGFYQALISIKIP